MTKRQNRMALVALLVAGAILAITLLIQAILIIFIHQLKWQKARRQLEKVFV